MTASTAPHVRDEYHNPYGYAQIARETLYHRLRSDSAGITGLVATPPTGGNHKYHGSHCVYEEHLIYGSHHGHGKHVLVGCACTHRASRLRRLRTHHTSSTLYAAPHECIGNHTYHGYALISRASF